MTPEKPYTRRFLAMLRENRTLEGEFKAMLSEQFEDYNNHLIAAIDWPNARFAQGALAAIQHLLDLPEKEQRDERAKSEYADRANGRR